ncbi:MAG: hypothetical protein KIT11_11460 [Fimbriimonadaceae bacterium]|nr:hypothetical protein [Fimbriimonadaceae bacterium]QYK55350.1 MAG: hypothetical protein KF733_10075 [Fimbriimonadaceae bacterium]
MTTPERVSNIREEHAQKALLALVPGIVLDILGAVLISYGREFTALGYVLLVIGFVATVYGAVQLMTMRKVRGHVVECPFCHTKNEFQEVPEGDVRCEGCHRSIPIVGGQVVAIHQVRCGFCNHLNYYSDKSTGLICEECNREVPIALADGTSTKSRAAFESYTVHDDERPYDLLLAEPGNKDEELISCLQKMLALNRNQVKQLLEDTPVLLLSGIPRRKAEMLKAQIDMHHGLAEYRVSQQV